MSIFTKAIGEISFADVENFCKQGVAEGVNLDYKTDFPKDLYKVIAAFANTHGGVIIIGVKEDDDGRPVEYKGITHSPKLEDRVTNIVVENIFPPVFPEVRVCPQKNKRTFVVIRIPESNETPHAIANTTKCYIRTGNRVKPENLATMEQLEWLQHRRKRSVILRKDLYMQSRGRYKKCSEFYGKDDELEEAAILTLQFCPLYPKGPLVSKEDLRAIVKEIRAVSGHESYPDFDAFMNYEKPVKDGIIGHIKRRDHLMDYYEASVYGLFCSVTREGMFKPQEGQPTLKLLHLSWIMNTFDLSLECMGSFYEKIGHWGLVEVTMKLENFGGFRAVPPVVKGRRIFFDLLDDTKINETDTKLEWSLVVSAPELRDATSRLETWLKMGSELSWSFGFFGSPETALVESLQERQRHALLEAYQASSKEEVAVV